MRFTQVLQLCAKAGLVKAGIVALDGTKVKLHPMTEKAQQELKAVGIEKGDGEGVGRCRVLERR